MSRKLLLILLLLAAGASYSQEQPEPAPVSAPDLLTQTLEQDIATSDYYRLVEWLKGLGLDAAGGVQDLRSRLFAHYKITPANTKKEARQTITIDTAYGTEYFTLEQVDEEYIRLSGGVSLTLRDNEKKTDHRIKADQVLMNQKTNTLTARGRVEYRMTKEGSDESFQGDSLTFNLDDWKGIFYDGVSSRKRTVSGSSLDFHFAGDTIKRNQRDMVVLEQGVITSSIPESPYYRIQARKIWVMAPGEWGLENAVLYVGRVPVFYFPFFYQPGDEMFFNPVLGLPTKPDRRGTYLQTTTYLMGSKKKDASPLSFLQIDDGGGESSKTEIRGLYLVRPERTNSESPGVNKENVMKILVDLYSNLGLYAAWEGSLVNLGPLKKLTFLSAAAGSFSVYRVGQSFSPFPSGALDPQKSLWEQWSYNKSSFFGQELPLRYAAEFSADLDLFRLNLEYYSDPFMTSDFRDRTENFSMFSLLGFGPKSTAAAEKSSLFWKGDWKFSLPPSPFSPWIKTLTVSNVGSSLEWARKSLSGKSAEDPGRAWFSPSRASFASANVALSGDLLGFLNPASAAPQTVSPPPSGGSATKITLSPPWADPMPPSPEGDIGDKGAAPGSEPAGPGALPPLTPPGISGNINLTGGAQSQGTGSVSLNYSYSPRFNHQAFFNQEKWITPDQMDWKTKYSQLYFNEDGRLGLRWAWGSWGFMEESMNYVRGLRMSYDFLPELTAVEKNNLLAGDAQNSLYKINQSFRLSLTPLGENFFLKSPQVSYSLASKVLENKYLKFDEASGAGVYESILPEWTKEGVTSHELSASFALTPFASQDLLRASTTMRAVLPPRSPERILSQSLSARLEWLRGSVSSGLRYVEADDSWKRDPLKLSVDLEPLDIKLNSALEWDFEKEEWTAYTASVGWQGFSARYAAAFMAPYTFNPVSRKWEQGSAQSFVPRDAQVAYRLAATRAKFWKNRIELSGNLSTSLTVDLQRLTNIPLGFDLTGSLKVFENLDLTLTSKTTNKAIFRYIPGLTDSLGLNLPTLNPLEDLYNSFAFWDENLRRESNFNLNNISIGLTHTMPDWTFTYKYSGFPQKNTALKKFEWVTNFSFSVIWKPIPEIRNETSVDAKDNYTVKINS